MLITPLASTELSSSPLFDPPATSNAILSAVSTTSKPTSAVNPANIAPSFALTTEPVCVSSTVMLLASVKWPATSAPPISAIKPAALSTTSNSISAVNPAKSPPMFALTDVSLAVTISTPATFSTLSVAEISAAALSVMS